MAGTTKGDEIFFHIPSQQAARPHMMNLQIFGTSASLAPPAIALEHSMAKLPVSIPLQTKPGLFWDEWIHDAFGIRSKNSWRWEFGSSR
jgi:hypothetical protein